MQGTRITASCAMNLSHPFLCTLFVFRSPMREVIRPRSISHSIPRSLPSPDKIPSANLTHELSGTGQSTSALEGSLEPAVQSRRALNTEDNVLATLPSPRLLRPPPRRHGRRSLSHLAGPRRVPSPALKLRGSPFCFGNAAVSVSRTVVFRCALQNQTNARISHACSSLLVSRRVTAAWTSAVLATGSTRCTMARAPPRSGRSTLHRLWFSLLRGALLPQPPQRGGRSAAHRSLRHNPVTVRRFVSQFPTFRQATCPRFTVT